MLIPYAIEEEVHYRGKPILVYAFCMVYLLAHIILYHFMGQFFRENIFYDFGCVPMDFKWWTPITCTFLHGGYLHLIGNLYFFWIYGRSCERRLGSIRFLIIYVIGAYASVIAHVICVPEFYSDIPTIGASGAISAVLGAFLVLFPTVKIRFLVISIISTRPLPSKGPAYFVLGAWFIVQIAYSMQLVTKDNMQVAFWAHIAGFAAGALIGTVYLLLHQANLSKKSRYHIELLLQAWEALANGDKANAQVLCDEFIEEKGSVELTPELKLVLNILEERLAGKSDEMIKQLSEEMKQARKNNNFHQIVQCYYFMVTSRHPKEIPSWLHREGAIAASKTGLLNLALYGFSCELVSGINERTDQFIYTLFNLLGKMGKDEEAKKLGNMLKAYYPSSQYAEMLEETSP